MAATDSLYSADEIAIANLAAHTPNLTLEQRKVLLTSDAFRVNAQNRSALAMAKSFVRNCLERNAAQVARASSSAADVPKAAPKPVAPRAVAPKPAPAPAPVETPLTLRQMQIVANEIDARLAALGAGSAGETSAPSAPPDHGRREEIAKAFGVSTGGPSVRFNPATQVQEFGAR